VPARGLLLVGDLPCAPLRGHHQWLAELAAACGWPIISEPSANLHDAPTALGHGVLVLGSPDFLAEHTPDLIVTAGLFGLSRPTLELVRRAGRHVALDLPSAGREVCDPLRTADLVLPGIPLPPTQPVTDPAWWAAWRAADAVAAAVVTQALRDPRALIGPVIGDQAGHEAGPEADPAPLTGAAVASRVWERAPDDALLLVAASWPVRQVEAFGGRRSGLRVIGNRGANGIDGLVSTAWGAALAHQQAGGGPALALLGDLALLHDHNGMLVGPNEPPPDLVLVVVDNDGGGIFHQLEQGRPEHAAAFERLFGTPLGRDLVAVSRAAGIPARRVSDGAGLESALSTAMSAGGVHMVVADAPDRAGEARLLEAVRSEVARRLTPAD
jgi:2-succinyl-5-enolpyruvyl-6-hydroxy-3-cyclohexene-1-carboxylate synthase